MMTSLLLKALLVESDIAHSRNMKSLHLRRDSLSVDRRQDLEHICRACGDTGRVHIFSTYAGRTVANDMRECCNIQVSEQDGLPAWLCAICLRLLRGAVRFRDMCLAAELALQQSLKADAHDLDSVTKVENCEQFSDCASPLWQPSHETNCKYCNKEFSSKKQCKDHARHCELPKAPARRRVKADPTDRESAYKVGKPHLCETCGKAFRTVAHLKIHRSVHETVFPYRCVQCAYRGKTPALLREHARMHASKAYMCAHCPAAFRTKSNLNKHMLTHRTEQPAQCNLCEKVLRHASSLKAHMKQVHGERPVVCDVCGKTIKTKKQLSRHRAKIHNLRTERTGRRPLYLQFPEEGAPQSPHQT